MIKKGSKHMKTIEIEVRYGVTKNCGKYESLRLDYTTRVQIGEKDNPIERFQNIRETLREELDKAVISEMDHILGFKLSNPVPPTPTPSDPSVPVGDKPNIKPSRRTINR